MIKQEEYGNGFLKGVFDINYHLKKKEKEDFLERCHYYYGMYSANQTFIGHSGLFGNRDFKKMRDHARGRMNMDKYKTFLDPMKKKGAKQTSSNDNISYEPAMFLSKFRDIVKDKFSQVNTVPETTAIDELARKEKSSKYNKMRFMSMPETNQWLQAIGMPAKEQDAFGSVEDVDIYYRMGGVRLGVEIMMKDALDSTKADSGWSVLQQMLIEDIIDVNAMAYAIEVNAATGRLEYKYVDPARVGMRNSIYPDARDSDFKFYIETINASTIRAEAPELTEDEIQTIKNTYTRYNSWRENRSGTREEYANNEKMDATTVAGDCRADVMTLYFIDRQLERYVSGIHPMGNRIFDKVDYDSKLSGRDANSKVIEEYIIHNVYKCKWVVGTDIIYNYGMDHNIVREGKKGVKRPIIPIITFVGQEPSIIERCVGFDDDIQLATLKGRQLLASLPPGPRMIFDKSALNDSVQVGGQEYSILEMLNMYVSSGKMVVETLDEGGIPGIDDNYQKKNPIMFVPSGIVEDMRILQETINFALEGIRQVTGINPITDGTNVQGDMLKSVMAGMAMATNSALMPHIRWFISTLETGYNICARKWMLMAAQGEITIENLQVAHGMFKNAIIGGEIFDHEWAIYINMESREDRQFLLQDLMSKKDFISADVYYIIYNAIKDGDTKKAQLILAKHTQETQKQEHAKQMDLVKAQGDSNAAAAERAMEAEIKKLSAEYDAKEKLKTHSTNEDIRKMEREYELKVPADVTKELIKQE